MDLHVELDTTGFPLIKIDPDGFYIHWIPVTKIQMEYFLSSGSAPKFNAEWYNTLLEYNERVTPSLVRKDNYWQSFVTGILPAEIKQFASWLGKEYNIPLDKEWQTAYRFLKEIEADERYIEAICETPGLNRRAKTLIKNMEISLQELNFNLRGGRKLADQALMRNGVMEFVFRDERRNTYGGYGMPNSTFFGTTANPDKAIPERLVNEQQGAKMPHYGFRLLIKRG